MTPLKKAVDPVINEILTKWRSGASMMDPEPILESKEKPYCREWWRWYFAGQALGNKLLSDMTIEEAAEHRVRQADAMITQLEQKK